ATHLAPSALIFFIFHFNSYNHFSPTFSSLHFLKQLPPTFPFYFFSPPLFFLLIPLSPPTPNKNPISLHPKQNSLK
ncbi:hypothetical protein, partial [Bacillus subtilis]|uniref:hypothetical protein n=1 Tax=Bacillus subtilis TaxID=1423 RepID=UPI0011A50048